MQLYIHKNGQQLGPYSEAEARTLIQTGTLSSTDLAWFEGMKNWVPLGQIPGLATAPFVPPPAPPVPVSLSAVTNQPSFEVLPPERPAAKKTQGILQWVIALGLLLFKYGFLLLKSGKTLFWMLFSIVIYSQIFGWRFAAGFVLLILLHELGHVAAAKWKGIPVTAPMFIPFVGAYVTTLQNPRDFWTNAQISYGGPLAGGIGAWLCWYAALKFHAPWLMAIASTTFVLNLVNLLPIPGLDGSPICAAVSRYFALVGFVLLSSALVYFLGWENSLWIIVIMLLFSFPQLMRAFSRRSVAGPEPYPIKLSDRCFMAGCYLGLIAALLLGYWNASAHLGYTGVFPSDPDNSRYQE